MVASNRGPHGARLHPTAQACAAGTPGLRRGWTSRRDDARGGALEAKVTISALQQMKREGRKIVGVVAYDYQMAQIVDRAGIDIVSVGDSVGINLWGQRSELDVTLDQMILTCQAVRRGV